MKERRRAKVAAETYSTQLGQLAAAIERGDAQRALELLARSAASDVRRTFEFRVGTSLKANCTALHVAARCNAGGGVVSRLLHVGGQELLAMADRDGKTARQLAADLGHDDVLSEIDRWAAQEAAWGQEATRNASLIAAARTNDLPALKALLAKGVNLYFQDAEGCSALHAAAQAGHTEAAALLLEQGGGRLAALTTKEGRTARDLAVCLQRNVFVAVPELTNSMDEVLGCQVGRVDEASRPSPDAAARTSMIALLDSEMARLEVAALQSQTDIAAADKHESTYLRKYDEEQAGGPTPSTLNSQPSTLFPQPTLCTTRSRQMTLNPSP